MARGHDKLDFSLVGVIPPGVPFQLRSGSMRWSPDVNSNEIRFLGGDYGGFMAVYPPLLSALEAGYKVFLCLTATSAEKYRKGELKLDSRIKVLATDDMVQVEEYFREDQTLTVVAASQSDLGAHAATLAILSSKCRSVVVQDLYGSFHSTLDRLESGMDDELNDLDCICVSDEFSAQLMLQQFPQLEGRIVVTGGPQFDKTIQVKEQWQQRRRQLREVLGIKEDDLVFLAAGQKNGTAEILEMVDDAAEMAGIAERTKVIVRMHPGRATDEEKRLLATHLQFTKRKWFCNVEKSLVSTSEELLPAADYILSGYSTTNYHAILCGMVGVVYVGTPALKKDLWQEKQLERPPEVEAGAGWYASTAAELQEVIEKLEYGPASEEVHRLRQAQERISQYNDGKAAERVWEQMLNVMNN